MWCEKLSHWMWDIVGKLGISSSTYILPTLLFMCFFDNTNWHHLQANSIHDWEMICCYDFHGVVALTRVGFGEILRNFPGLGILAGLFWKFLWNNLYILAFAMMMTFHDIWYESGQEETQWSISVNNSQESPRWWSVINFYTKCTNTVQRQIRNQNNKKE